MGRWSVANRDYRKIFYDVGKRLRKRKNACVRWWLLLTVLLPVLLPVLLTVLTDIGICTNCTNCCDLIKQGICLIFLFSVMGTSTKTKEWKKKKQRKHWKKETMVPKSSLKKKKPTKVENLM